MRKGTIGWDVGGAHLKAAYLNNTGQLEWVIQVPCALWRGLAELESAIDAILREFPSGDVNHAITMTGELVDLFANRKEGVLAISQVMENRLIGDKQFYTGALQADYQGFTPAACVAQHWQAIASANWLASAAYVASRLHSMQTSPYALLIDIGSTTTDFVVLKDHQPVCKGYTDAERLQSGELVYTGIIRTPLMAVSQEVVFEGKVTSTAAEYFATTADVYRLTGELSASDDMADTADGKEKTLVASVRRIARMIGRDAEEAELSSWVALAQSFRAAQFERLRDTVIHHAANFPDKTALTLIGAGVGRFLVKDLAAQMHVNYIDVADLVEQAHESAMLADTKANSPKSRPNSSSSYLPAVAVASLLHAKQSF
jgi:probable H4MPT-linked C1 transfer pathway protein